MARTTLVVQWPGEAVGSAQVTVLLIGPGASWATADVAAGLREGLTHHGVEIVDYALDTRIARSQSWLYYNWRQHKKRNPTVEKPNVADVFLQAGRDAFWVAWWIKTFRGLDAILIVSGMFIHPDVVMVMKASGLPIFVLFTESPYDLEKELAFAKLVDGCWTNERSSIDAFQSVNQNSGYLPHGWHATRHRPGPQPGDEAQPSHDVVFVGSAFQERVEWLSSIDWTGIDFGLYGSWESLGSRHPLRRFVRGNQTDNAITAALYRRAKIGLNLYRTSMGWGKQAPSITHAESLNPRAYELAACGAFHLSTYREEVAEIFGDLVPTFEVIPEATLAREAAARIRYTRYSNDEEHQAAEKQVDALLARATQLEAASATALIRSWLADPAGRAAISGQLPACVAESSWRNRAATVIGDLQTLLQQRAA